MYIYRFKNIANEVIYIGETNNLHNQMKLHFFYQQYLTHAAYDEVTKVEYIEVCSKTETSMKKIYYINAFSPKYNKAHKNADNLSSISFNDDWLDYLSNSSNENFSLVMIGNTILSFALKYVKLTLDRKENDPSGYSQHSITFLDYEEGFNHWYKNTLKQNLEPYNHFKKVVFEQLLHNRSNKKTDTVIAKLNKKINNALMDGYIEFCDIDLSEYSCPGAIELYVQSIFNHEMDDAERKSLNALINSYEEEYNAL